MASIQYAMWASDGRITVIIDNVLYEYLADTANFPNWKRRASRAPWKVLNEIKQCCKLLSPPAGQRKEIIMNNTNTQNKASRAMNEITLKAISKDKGYLTDGVKHVCPDCYAVFLSRRKIWAATYGKEVDKELITKSAKKLLLFKKEGAPSMKACPCGYRHMEGKDVSHSLQWVSEFPEAYKAIQDRKTAATPEVQQPAASCSAKTAKGDPCKNKPAGDGKFCAVHGGAKRLF